MRKYIALFLISMQVLISCESDPVPTPTPKVDEPGKAGLSLPENDKECEQGEINGNSAAVTFSWNASDDTDNYDLKITNLDDNTFTTKTGITNTSIEVSLERGHPYSWVITSRNSGSVSTNSDTWKFYLAGDGESNFAPFPASAIAPTPGATVTPAEGKVTLQWESVSDPDGDPVVYTLYADKVDGQQTPPAQWQNISGTSMEITVDPNTVYYWRIITSDGRNTAASSTYSFKTTG